LLIVFNVQKVEFVFQQQQQHCPLQKGPFKSEAGELQKVGVAYIKKLYRPSLGRITGAKKIIKNKIIVFLCILLWCLRIKLKSTLSYAHTKSSKIETLQFYQ
jgi:hypothetical protein